MNKFIFQVIIAGFLLTIFFACNNTNMAFEEYKPIPENGWHKDSVAIFNIPITDTLQNHNLYINTRNDIKYKYSNLWLFIEIIQPGKIGITDTLELLLADQRGKWLGEGFGGIKTQQVVYKSGVFFPVSGEYTVNIRHGMRDETLNGITDIGFRVEKIVD
ncbi:MAG: gliding motility lipoprotein GldH [Draconibacterium sp.]|nr:gliding motility lipoprotein GldH [Draconibacterium sp.]